ncbi:calcium/sodium antiporter [Sulfurospirillum barnesii]|uniref:K+dependent Na+ exchanger related-protein n=1 Tax=Sulfurospirillum barnesii (strain ATCC 700032 / DSM 10660 / SES-3) TaxID=760154 RepID=I3XWM8_SULBS|nr:calcium/sodium antiporter [Sulfurospirillum barnesii]AFL68352.1 K+dependent Na+ exchanger related-protein [Sulfurospirillum barnesii SES-3]
MLLFSLALLLGLILLVWSADKFVDGATALALNLGMPTLLIGILIVGFGTSAPEIAVSSIAAFNGTPALAMGNALGSNIANIGLILGISALIVPIALHSNVVKKNILLSLGITLLSGYMLFDATLSLIEGIVLLVALFGFIGWTIRSGLKTRRDKFIHEIEDEIFQKTMSLPKSIVLLLIGLVLLVGSSQLLVWGAVGIATILGVSDLIIGLTIVAVGTSLPELATSIAAVKKGESDIAIGNVVGSNIFNILAVMGVAATIAPDYVIAPEIFYRDWGVMFMMSFALFFMAYGGKHEKNRIGVEKGAVLLLGYVVYTLYLVMGALYM